MAAKKRRRLLQKRKPTPKPSVEPKPKPPSFAQKGTEFESADQKWNEKSATGKFNKSGKANVGGAHEKSSGPMRMAINGCLNRPRTPRTTSSLMVRKPHIKSAV